MSPNGRAIIAKCGGVAELPSCKLCVECVLRAVRHGMTYNRIDVPARRFVCGRGSGETHVTFAWRRVASSGVSRFFGGVCRREG